MTYEEGYDYAKRINKVIDYLNLITDEFTAYEAIDFINILNKYTS